MDKANVSLIGRKVYKYNDKITVVIPTVNQIRGIDEKNEMSGRQFWMEVNLFTQTPSDCISELDAAGIDFTEISEYGFFILSFFNLKTYCQYNDFKPQIFKGLDLWDLELSDDGRTLNDEDGIVIDEKIYGDLSDLICYMTCREKTKPKKFGNEFAKKKRIEQDYKKKEKVRKEDAKGDNNFFDRLILRLVCNADFPYDFTTVGEISLFEFMYSLKQIDKNINVDNLMMSGFYGNDLKKYSVDDLSRYVI